MTAEHQCDNTFGRTDSEHPLTMARVLRIIIGRLDPHVDDEEMVRQLFSELGGCSNCLTGVAIAAAGIAADLMVSMPGSDRQAIIDNLDRQLTAYLDQLG